MAVEYHKESFYQFPTVETLNKLGLEGWRYVFHYHDGLQLAILFMREKPETEASARKEAKKP